MTAAPRDGSTVIVLSADFSTAFAYVWDVDRDCWLQLDKDWNDRTSVQLYTYDEELDGYGWVPAPDKMYEGSSS